MQRTAPVMSPSRSHPGGGHRKKLSALTVLCVSIKGLEHRSNSTTVHNCRHHQEEKATVVWKCETEMGIYDVTSN